MPEIQAPSVRELIRGADAVKEAVARLSAGLEDGGHGGAAETLRNPARKPLLRRHDGTRPFVARTAGYYDTVWPSEHTDLWRSHAALDTGLPAGFDPERLSVATAGMNVPVWGYTRARDEVFVAGGSPFILDTFTRSIQNGEPLSGPALLRSIVRDLLDDSVPYVARIHPRTMEVAQADLTEGRTVNYTGGLLVHQNGFVYAVAQSVLYKVDPETMRIERHLRLPLVGEGRTDRFWTTYNGMQVLASGELVLKGFHLLDSATVPGWLLLVDPDDLSVDVQQAESVSSARLTIQQSEDGETYLYHVNAFESLRFTVSDDGFARDHAWTRSYREDGSGSTQASSPLLFGNLGQVAFADNTAPGATTPIQLYAQAVDGSAPAEGLPPTPAFSTSPPGFNFFMVAADPLQAQLLVYYDPINDLLAAHRMDAGGTLEPVWERDVYKCSASPAIVPDRDLLYVDDYRDGRDHLVVLRLSTGEELASVELPATLPTVGTILPGMNDDVFLLSSETGGSSGMVSRVYVAGPER